jgi:hypothetical protein
MGRKNEFKVTKAFSMGLQEMAFLKVESEANDLSVSAFVNKIVRSAMLKAQGKEVKKSKPVGHCHKCSVPRGYVEVGKEWICEVCKTEKTEYITEIVRLGRTA